MPASKLGPIPTRDATRQAANQWWQRKQAEIDGAEKTEEQVLLDQLVEQTLGPTPEIQNETLEQIPREFEVPGKLELLRGLVRRTTKPDRCLQACGQMFLDVVRGSMKPRSYEELAAYITSLNNMQGILTGAMDVGALNLVHLHCAELLLNGGDQLLELRLILAGHGLQDIVQARCLDGCPLLHLGQLAQPILAQLVAGILPDERLHRGIRLRRKHQPLGGFLQCGNDGMLLLGHLSPLC
jgi:hypothetical protein